MLRHFGRAVAQGLHFPQQQLHQQHALLASVNGFLCNTSSQIVDNVCSTSGRACYSSQPPARRAINEDGVVPAEILEQLRSIESTLHRQSRMDGRKRLTFSESSLPFAIPSHEIEQGLHTVVAHVRHEQATGSNGCKWLRRLGRTPACVMSIPGEKLSHGPETNTTRSLQIHMASSEADKLVRLYGRRGCTAHAVQLQLVHPEDPTKVLGTVRVKPQVVHMDAVSQRIENIEFLFCPQDRIVLVDVPIKLMNDDASPGVRKGAWMSMHRRTIRYQCLGNRIPPYIELDVKHMDVDTVLRVKDLPIPQGTRLPRQNYEAVIVHCTMDVGNE